MRASGKFAVSLKETENTSWEGSGREDQREMGVRVKAGRNRWSRAGEPKKGDAGGREGARLKHKDKTGGAGGRARRKQRAGGDEQDPTQPKRYTALVGKDEGATLIGFLMPA